MDYDYQTTNFSKALLAGLLTGMVGAVLNVIYNTVYREMTEYSPAEIFNAFTLIFGTCLWLLIAGMLFHLLYNSVRKGRLIFTAGIVLIAGICILLTVWHSQANASFAGLILGFEIITGILTAFLLPYLATHPKIYI